MNILMLSLDKRILEPFSKSAQRLIDYGNMGPRIMALIPDDTNRSLNLSAKVRVRGVNGMCKPIKLLKMFFFASRVIKFEKIHVISAQDTYYIGLLGWCLARKHKIGFEAQVHGFEGGTVIRKKIARLVIGKADSVRVVSARLKTMLINKLGISEGRITVVPIYVPFVTEAGERTYEITGRAARFLTVARLVEVKRIDLMIEAIEILNKDGLAAELSIVGDGPLAQNLKDLVVKKGLGGKVRFEGWQTDTGTRYLANDIYVLASDSEGWGMSVIEAAATGMPIVMTDVGLAGEVIINNKSGLVVPAGDAPALAEAMKTMAIDKETRKKSGEAAKTAWQNLPDKETTFKLYLKSWQRAIDNKKITYEINNR